MGHRRARTAAIALLVCLPSLSLAAWPALGLWADGVRRTPERLLKQHGPDPVWTDGVRISGDVQARLSPGTGAPVTVRFSNANPEPVAMQRVRVSIAGISAPHADATHRCTPLDFEIHQMPRRALWIPARRVADLASLGIPAASWPTLAMRNLPRNQDGCKNASVTLRLRAVRLESR